MSGYKCVNYYDLCRLCTTSSGTRINIFSDEGRKKSISQKISECLPVMVEEKDNLPKTICETCITQVESIFEFRTVCLNSQAMLEGCINATLQNGGKIYIKEGGMTLKNISVSTNNTATNQTSTINQTNSDFLSSIIQAVGIQNEDIQDTPKTNSLPQYTITMDGKSLSSNQIEYKVQEIPVSSVQTQPVEQQQTDNSEKHFKNNSLAEFLKMKPNIRVTPVKKKQPTQLTQNHIQVAKQQKSEINQQIQSQPVAVQTDIIKKTTPVTRAKKQKFNVVLTSPTSNKQHITPQVISQQIVPTQQIQQLHLQPQNTTTLVPTSTLQPTITTKSLTVPDWKFVSAPSSKCFLPITIKDSSNNDQQIVAQIDTKNLILPATYQLQMKLQPQLTIDGQQIVQLTPSSIPATISLAPQQTITQAFHQDHQILTTTGIDAATSTNESESTISTNLNNQQSQNLNLQPTNLNIQQIQTIQNAAVSLPHLQIKNISSALTSNISTQQVTPQKLFNNSITVQRITNSATVTQNKQQPLHQQVQQQTIQQKQVQQQTILQKQQSIQQQPQATQNQITQQATQVQYIQQPSGINKAKPVKLIRTTKLNAAQAKQVATQLIKIANKKNPTLSNTDVQTVQKQQQTTTSQKLPVRKAQPPNKPQFVPLPTKAQMQLQQPALQQQQPSQRQQQSVQQQQQQQQQQTQPQQQNSNSSVKKTLPLKTSNPAFANTTPSAAAALAKVNPVTNLLECSVCSRGFKKKEHLAQHMKLHAGLRPFKCSETGCTKAFSRKEHLMRHIVSHTGKKMFSCDMCQKFFSRKDNLNKHKRTHSEQSSNSGNGQFICDVCNKSFVVKMYYLQHKLLHEKNEQQTNVNSKSDEQNSDETEQNPTTTDSSTITTNSIKFQTSDSTNQIISSNIDEINGQIHHKAATSSQRQQQKNQPQLVQLQLPVSSSNNFNGGTITISQPDGTTTTTVLKTLGNHDATVLNLPTSLANYMQLNSAQFITTSGEIVGHIKIDK